MSQLYEERDLRLSYVMWQEMVPPMVVVELLSPGTEKEDLGSSKRLSHEPPTKWEVYEQILRVPYYIVFDRYTDELKAFALTAGSYQQIELQEPKIWMPQLQLGLGLWSGTYEGITRTWLRWYDSDGNWILTASEEKAVVEEQLQAERSRSQRLAELLRAQGIDPDSIT